MTPPSDFLTPAKAAELLSAKLDRPVTAAAVRKYARAGLLPGADYIGEGTRRTWLIPRSSIDVFVLPRRGQPPHADPSPGAAYRREYRKRKTGE